MEFFSYDLFIAVSIYILGISSPGPSNLAIAHTSIHAGRKAGVFFALGITFGSFFWGVLAASGLKPILTEYGNFLYFLKILGGLYFLYLAYISFSLVLKKEDKRVKTVQNNDSFFKYFISGVMMHLLNPKAIAVWVAIIAVALPINSDSVSVYLPVLVCLPLGIIVFIGYAFMFSTKKVVKKYFDLKRYIDSLVGATFAIVGLKLLFDNDNK
ncbi:LysE family translocator [Halarcobacter anaerophilus]|jgi:threonine/homoserine/homoserine lactone efflux protein|uniref:LysE family translocator n=1 Tax=Halarcobacter anaerophilus TaxID=877500 RepID=UPI0005C85B42|nr:LysE family translocator [Halarcobacter anaerophilus]